jgi:Protein of unknown function (DUF1761)
VVLASASLTDKASSNQLPFFAMRECAGWFQLAAQYDNDGRLCSILVSASMGAITPSQGEAMTYSGTNYLAILIAAVAAWLAGAGWYMALGKPWMAALGLTPEQMEARKREPGAYLPFIYCFVAELVMAWVLAGVLGHFGALTLRGGVISAALCWLGFVLTTLLVNNSFANRDRRLLLIDGGHWLLVLVLMGAIIGGMGA